MRLLLKALVVVTLLTTVAVPMHAQTDPYGNSYSNRRIPSATGTQRTDPFQGLDARYGSTYRDSGRDRKLVMLQQLMPTIIRFLDKKGVRSALGAANDAELERMITGFASQIK